jgi:uncharacterized ferredoxin-like protein
MINRGNELKMDFFRINGELVKVSNATLLIGVEGHIPLGINCGGCGHATCAEMVKAVKAGKNKKALYMGPNCVLKISDLGIAVGSAVKTASIHNVDNHHVQCRCCFPAAGYAQRLQCRVWHPAQGIR